MFFRIFPSISVLLVINSLNSLQVNGLLRSDESFVQPIGGMHFTWDLMKSMHTMMKPEISEFERLFGTQFLGQVRFFVYMDGPQYHESEPKAADETTNVQPDFSFTLNTARKIPHDIRPFFRNKGGEKFAFIIYGWQANFVPGKYYIHKRSWCAMVASDLRTFRHMNVIIVDWPFLSTWDYFKASQGNVLYVAELIKKLLDDIMLVNEANTKRLNFLSNVLLIGHSLGAHIAGRVGSLYFQQIRMIVGLDPAGPLFHPFAKDRHCLTSADAQNVIIFHTTAGLGSNYMLGSVDLFVNGGAVQPECNVDPPMESHKRAVNVFRATIYQKNSARGYFCAKINERCSDWELQVFVFDIDSDDLGKLYAPIYLPTIGTQPFFLNHWKPDFIPAYSAVAVHNWNRITYLNNNFIYKPFAIILIN